MMKSSVLTTRFSHATLLLYATTILARFIDHPLPTDAAINQAPAAPVPVVTAHREFRIEARSAESIPTYTITYAPDSVCGYLSGEVEIPITCENKNKCLWEQEYFKFIACELKGETTGIARTSCYAKDEALNATLCQDSCVSNTYNLLCPSTNDTAPFCRTYAYPNDVRDYRCASTPATRVSTVDFTFDGQKYPKWTLSTVVDGDTAPQSLTPTSTSTTSDITSAKSEPAATSSTPADKDDGNLSTGAIVGISVGAVVGFLLIGGVVYLWLRQPSERSRNGDILVSDPRPVSPSDQQPEFVHTGRR
ncbi:hypothetical protein FHETE_2590 [Fusarium heterosporum]|uniref:Mid2 domain-containing protein n=1 Tax=Fusarium heterosporum TaxID=42747 RepID=A0A8H5TSB6_FUSHE|nr:hypothetical protein FHETE_2590 [Fusarium heterosporum]